MNIRKRKINFTNPLVIAILALTACFLWGSAFPSIKIGYRMLQIQDVFGEMVFAGARFVIAGLMVFIICLLTKNSIKVTRAMFLKLAWLGLIQTSLQYFFFYSGMSMISGTTGSILSSLSSFFSVLLAPLFFKSDRLTIKKLLGIMIGFMGIVILNFQGASFTFQFRGEGYILISSMFAALASIYTKKLTGLKLNTFIISAYQLFLGGLVLGVIGLSNYKVQLTQITPKFVLLLIYMGFISAAAFSIWTLLLAHNPVGIISVYKFSIPLFGSFLSLFLLNERSLNINVLISLLFVAVGILLINVKKGAK